MSNTTKNTYKLDVKKGLEIKRGQIYLCDLNEDNPNCDNDIPSLSTTGLISKRRPCIVISTPEHHKKGSILFRIAPIKSNHTSKSAEDYVRDSYDVLIPINMPDGTKFIVVNQTRAITIKRIVSYLCEINNPEILDKVDQEIIKMDTGVDLSELMPKDTIDNVFGNYETYAKFCSDNKDFIAKYTMNLQNSRSIVRSY